MVRGWWGFVCVAMVFAAGPGPACAQKSVAEVLGRPATPEGQPKSYLEELMLFSYVENSYVGNLRQTGRGNVNELRFYDHDAGYTFNAAEVSVKKDPSERYRLGYGVVITGGVDSQKNHSLGIFRDKDDQAPLYANTPYPHTGLLVTYPFAAWFSATIGFTNGWDNADNNNGYLRPIGSFAFTPTDKFSATVNYLFGPEQNRNQMRGDDINYRWIVDT